MQSCCGGSSRFSGHVRLMQRPELVKTRRPAAAAAELERQYSSERRKTMERERMRRRPVAAIYKEGLISEHEKRGDRNMVIQLPRCLDFRKGI